MKRNGIRQLQVNGQESFDIQAGRNGRNANGGSDVARRIEQGIACMLQHLNQPLRVSALAAAVNVSPSHYSAVFKRLTGSPPIDFFIHLRMERACRLFDRTSLNAKEVAAALGYDAPFYFTRVFKSVNQLAPTDYCRRKVCKSAPGLDGADLACGSRAKRISGTYPVPMKKQTNKTQ